MVERPVIKGGGVLGEKITEARRTLDTFLLPESTEEVTYTSDEVASFCPITRQPDWYTVEISIQNSNLGLESKALKLYLQSFNNQEEGQFCEKFADTIAEDVYQAVNDDTEISSDYNRSPEVPAVRVQLKQKPRGGISIEAVSVKGEWEY